MTDPQFHQTAMGREFFDRTMPKLADALDKFANILEKLVEQATPMRETLEFTLPFIALELQRHNDLLERLTDVFEERFDHSGELVPRLPSRLDFDVAMAEYRKRRSDDQL